MKTQFEGRTRERPSAAIVLGALSGFLAGFLYFSISVPLVLTVLEAEQALALRRSRIAAETVERWGRNATPLHDARLANLGVDWATIRPANDDNYLYAVGQPSPQLMGNEACAAGPGSHAQVIDGMNWATTCVVTDDFVIAAGTTPEHRIGSEVLYWTFMLAVVVGIVTALGQARLLRPLTAMSRAVERIGRGERVEQLETTGLAELDAVVDRINEAAIGVEERVDAITARITLVQEMARLVAHEVRNPLQSLELLTSLIATEEDTVHRTQIASGIRSELQALDQVVHRLLRQGASQGALSLQRKIQPVAPLVETIAQVRKIEAARRGVRLTVRVDSWRQHSIDGPMLGRSIENLVTNALQAVQDHRGEVRIALFEEEGDICITVDDNGSGVDPSIGDQIFEANVTGRATGTGLGLALVRAVLVAHGGTIDYSTSPLGGARFTARIPIEPVGATDD